METAEEYDDLMHEKNEKSEPERAGIPSLDNYRDLLARVDILCDQISQEFGTYLACRAGCAGCCRHISLFPVEAVALATALRRLPAEEAAAIRARADGASPDGGCPRLDNGLC